MTTTSMTRYGQSAGSSVGGIEAPFAIVQFDYAFANVAQDVGASYKSGLPW